MYLKAKEAGNFKTTGFSKGIKVAGGILKLAVSGKVTHSNGRRR